MSCANLLKRLQTAHPVLKALTYLEDQGIKIWNWNPEKAHIRCPGEHLHTTPNGRLDCSVRTSKHGPYLKCFHTSCLGEIADWNHKLNGVSISRWNPGCFSGYGTSVNPLPVPKWDQARIDAVIAGYPWTSADIVADSPEPQVAMPIKYQAACLLSLFDPRDIVWIGRDIYDSGRPGHRWRFLPAKQWIDRNLRDNQLGAFICPNTFNPFVHSRSIKNVKDQRFLVVESDLLKRDEVGSVFKWMQGKGHRLRAVVDTAGKSLHGWFECPAPNLLPGLKSDLTALGCDPAMFGKSQPCRLPGALRNGEYQKLLYLDA